MRSFIHQEFENLKKSSNVLQSLIESTNYGLALITTDFHVVELNNQMREWFPGIDIQSFPFCHKCLFSGSDAPCAGCPAVRPW